MSPFHYRNFFNTDAYLHASLFEKIDHVWEVLDKIAPYLKSQSLHKNEGIISPQAYLVYPELIFIGKGSIVEPGAYIQGPCIIGRDCQIRHGAYIRGNFLAGDDCTIGHCTEVKNAIFLNGVHADHFAYIGDSILGNHVHLGAGVKCANLRLDNSPITMHHAGMHYATGRRKFGAIIGDEAQLGCNAVTNPGTALGKNVHLLACTPFGGGFAPSNSEIRWDGKITVTPRKWR